MYSIRDLRNATAHSNCLINKLQKGINKPSVKIIKSVSNTDGIGTSTRKNKLSNKFLYDFITLLYVYNEFINADVVKERRFKQIMHKNSIFFCKKVVDYINEAC